MAQYQTLSVGILSLGDSPTQVRRGTNVTRATVLAECDDGLNDPGLGSLYLSTDRAYLRVAQASAATDWEKITTTAAD
jgi:hypothetical protein